MAFWDFLRPVEFEEEEGPASSTEVSTLDDTPTEVSTLDDTLTGILSKYDVVDVYHESDASFLVVSERKMLTETPTTTMEIGSSSPSPFVSFLRTEYNPELQGIRGLQKYDQMRKSDGIVQGTLRLVKTPVLAARWFIEPKNGKKKADKTAADFVWQCLTEEMSISWAQVLIEALLMCDFGYYMFEKVWENRIIDGKTRTVLTKLAPRHPMDVKKWIYDDNGGPAAVVMFPPTMDVGANGYRQDIVIPIDKLIVFTFNREAGNVEGISALRSAYKHWYYKEQLYKIDAIQKERHGIGVPIIKLPPNFTDADKTAANELGRNLRTNERAHVVLPPMWELLFAKLEGNMVDALKSVEVHDNAIRENVLAGFLKTGTTTKEEDQVMFLKATRWVADVVCDAFNLYLIPQLIKYNFDRVGTPRLRARRIGETTDWRTFSFAIRNLIGAGVLRADDKLEEYIREEMDLPQVDLATVRKVATPQAGPGQGPQQPGQPQPGAPQGPNAQNPPAPTPPRVGPPRQAAPSAKPPKANAGQDKSGGK